MTDKLTEQVTDLAIEDHQPRTNAIISNSETDRNLIPPSQRRNRRQSEVDYTNNQAFETIKSKHSMSSFNNRVREDDDRDLRSSNACLNLQENNSEVLYKNGRKSKINHKKLSIMVTRASVLENIDVEQQRLRKSYLQNLDSTGTLLGKNSSLGASITNSSDNVGYTLTNAEEYEQNESEINDQYYENYRRGSEEQENLHRVSSVVSNKEERLLREGLDSSEFPNKKRSTLSNEELVQERRKDPSMRKRPTSAGANATAKNSYHSHYQIIEDELRCLSDTELDTMEIALVNLNDTMICQF